jgi:putative transposase
LGTSLWRATAAGVEPGLDELEHGALIGGGELFDAWSRLSNRAVRGARVSVVDVTPSSSSHEPLSRRLRELALVRVSYGPKRRHVLLRRDGWTINHTRTRRLYREEGLQLGRYRGPKRRPRVGAGRGRPVRTPAEQPNVRWAMDFVHDQTASGTTFHVLTVIDVFSRECVALVARQQCRGDDVAAVLTQLLEQRGRPTTIQCDQGTEFTSIAMDAWAYWQHIPLDFSRRGTPGDNAVNEAFNGSLRRECLSQHHFLSVDDAQHVLDAWREDYNNHRPHSSLQDLAPAHFRAWKSETPDRSVQRF